MTASCINFFKDIKPTLGKFEQWPKKLSFLVQCEIQILISFLTYSSRVYRLQTQPGINAQVCNTFTCEFVHLQCFKIKAKFDMSDIKYMSVLSADTYQVVYSFLFHISFFICNPSQDLQNSKCHVKAMFDVKFFIKYMSYNYRDAAGFSNPGGLAVMWWA